MSIKLKVAGLSPALVGTFIVSRATPSLSPWFCMKCIGMVCPRATVAKEVAYHHQCFTLLCASSVCINVLCHYGCGWKEMVLMPQAHQSVHRHLWQQMHFTTSNLLLFGGNIGSLVPTVLSHPESLQLGIYGTTGLTMKVLYCY